MPNESVLRLFGWTPDELKYEIGQREPICGIYARGTGTASLRKWAFGDNLVDALGYEPVDGTFNVWCKKEIKFKSTVERVDTDSERFDKVYLQPFLLGTKGGAGNLALGHGIRDTKSESAAYLGIVGPKMIREQLGVEPCDRVHVWRL